MNKEQLWINNPSLLYTNLNFNILSNNKTQNKLNILTRFMIITSILQYSINYNTNDVMIGILFILIIMIIYSMCKKDNIENFTDELNELQRPIRNSDYYNTTSEINNPLKNTKIPEYGTEPEYSEVNKSTDINKYINNKLFQTEGDYLFDTQARQYYTMPNNKTPNKQSEFANWLYGTNDNCKSYSIYSNRLGHSIENKNCSTSLNVSVPTNQGKSD